jgi:hypothetical protein
MLQRTKAMVDQLLLTTRRGGMINTAYIEQLNATFRRTRHLARQSDTLQTSLHMLGCVYNFCDFHQSLRLKLSVGHRGFRWVQRTPDLEEMFSHKTPPRPFTKKQGRGRKPNQ